MTHAKINSILILILILLLSKNLNAQNEAPGIISVSVNPQTGFVEISWIPSLLEDLQYYNVYKMVTTGTDQYGNPIVSGVPIVENLDTSIHSYLFEELDATLYSMGFQVAAANSLDKLYPSDVDSTIFLAMDETDTCKVELKLNWSPYIGWNTELLKYRIHARINNQQYVAIDSVLSDSLSYTYKNLETDIHYCFFIEAVHKNPARTAKSNLVCRTFTLPQPPKYINADYATITEPNSVELSFSLDQDAHINNYLLTRTNFVNSQSDTIYKVMNYASPGFIYTDEINTNQETYLYQLHNYNTCNYIVLSSNTAGNILLQSTIGNDIISLSWNPYLDWYGGVKEYRIFRQTGNLNYQLLTTTSSDQTTWQDDISSLKGQANLGIIHYYIEAEEGPGNPYSVTGISKSNIIEIIIEPDCRIPNAFTPNEDLKNDVFGPVDWTFLPNDYVFIIYNSWGTKIFETENPEEKWNGKYQGKYVPEGVYTYFIRYSQYKGSPVKKSGNVVVLYP